MTRKPKRQPHYALENLEETALRILPRRERENLAPGRVVILNFELDDPREGEFEAGVVEITGRAPGGEYVGRLVWGLEYVDLDAGDEVRFAAENIMDFHATDPIRP